MTEDGIDQMHYKGIKKIEQAISPSPCIKRKKKKNKL